MDHINVFPTFENYVDQFRIFANDVKEKLFYYAHDVPLQTVVKETCHAKCKPTKRLSMS